MSTPAQVSYEVYEGAEGLERLRSAWEALEPTGADHIFQTYAHAELWQRDVGEPTGARPLVVGLREDGRVVGIFPACRVWQYGVPLLTWVGAPRVLDYGDVIFDPEARTSVDEFVAGSLRILRRRAWGSALYLTNVRDDARAFGALSSQLREYRASTAPFVPIRGTWEDYLASRGHAFRKKLNRAQRRLSERGEVRFDLLSPGDPLVASAIARLVAFQRARFDARLDRTHMFDERFVRFRSDQAGKSPIRVATLSVGGEYVAVSMCAVFRGRLYAIVPGFDIAYADFSPGVLLKAFIIRSCFENGWDPCDFCWGDEQWKYRWTDSEMRLTTFVSDDAKGAVLATAAGARHGLIALRRRLWK